MQEVVSVIMPTFHQSQYLFTSVLGVMSQTYKLGHFERKKEAQP
jgi:hypothetical protein